MIRHPRPGRHWQAAISVWPLTPVISGLVADGFSTRTTLTFVMMLGGLCILFARGMPDRLYDGS